MQSHFVISTGIGGAGQYSGIGGRGGDVSVHLNYNDNVAASSADALLMSLPRADSAEHDSGRKDSPSPCLQGTRVAILEGIMSWLESSDGEGPPVYWLNGLAGLGKSTIAKTIAERAEERALLGATFFFSRTDQRLRDPQLVFPSLAFQLARSNMVFKNAILEALQRNPTVGYKKLLPQLQELILMPLLGIDPNRRPTLIIIDALDECEEKGAAEILHLLFSHAIRIPFLRILITSRPQPHLSSVFNKIPNLVKTVLHDIEASVIHEDIRFYISTELAKIPERLDLPMPPDWVAEDQKSSLVEKSGKLFIYAATAIRFIGDDRVRDPPTHLSLILKARSAQETGVTPYTQLDDLYMGVLRSSLSPYNHREIPKRFQVVVGSIVLLREPLPLHSLARFVQYERHIVEATLHHLHSVIVPPSNVHEAPRIYHPSFLEFIMDGSRCSMPEFVIVPVPDQEHRHVIRCLELMATFLKRDVAGISDPLLLNSEVDGFEEKVREALPPEVQYACRYWASHLSLVESGEGEVVQALQAFSMRSILWWLEAMSLIGSISTTARSVQEAHRWAIRSKCEPVLETMLYDAYRFILAHSEVITASALHIYHSALPFTPRDTVLYKIYCEGGNNSVRVLQGVEREWPRALSSLLGNSDSGGVRSVAFSPDGFRLASSFGNGTIRLWDAISGAHIATLKGHDAPVNTVAFSPDGLRLISGSNDHTLRLWDATSGVSIAKLTGHSDIVRTVVFSPDGLRLASGSSDCTLRLWDSMSGAHLATLYGHRAFVNSIAFSPDGLCLASGSSDRDLRLWDAISGMRITSLRGHWESVNAIAFSPDGSRLISGSDDNDLVLWDAVSGTQIAQLEGHSGPVRTVAFSPDGLRVASGSLDRSLRLWDTTSGAQIATLEDFSGAVLSLAFSPDGLRLASGSDDYSLRLWDAVSSSPMEKLERHSDWVNIVAFSPDGVRMASASHDCTLRLWDAMLGTHIAQLEGHLDWVNVIAFSPDGFRMASGSHDCTLRLWNAISGTHTARLKGHSDWITAIAFSPDGLRVASGSLDSTVRLWDAVLGTHIETLERHYHSVSFIVFSPDGLCVASSSSDYTLQLWDATSASHIAELKGHSKQVSEIAFCVDDRTVITRANKENFKWDLSSQPPCRIDLNPSEMAPALIASPAPLIWSLRDRWIHVERRQDRGVRRICYIPALYSPSPGIQVSEQETQYCISFGCMDGRVIILGIPHDLLHI